MIPASVLYARLLAWYGPQGWWPADDPFEILVGALLVQRTTWRGAETALSRLREAGLLSPPALAAAAGEQIEDCVRPAGFYRTKAARLRGLAKFLSEPDALRSLADMPAPGLRKLLLSLDGIGPETADTVLLYAFGHPVLVVDEYLRRLVRRLSGSDAAARDEALRSWAAEALDDPADLNELHALVVVHGKTVCRAKPVCGRCRLAANCRQARAGSDAELGERVGHVAQDS